MLVEHDLRADPHQADELAKLRVQEATDAFDLANGPLIRGRLLALGSREHVLLLTMHHIISDGWSGRILLNELSALYRGYHENAGVTLPVLEIQYADYAAWQREHRERHHAARAAWVLAAHAQRGYRKSITCRRTVLARRCKITAARSCASSLVPS